MAAPSLEGSAVDRRFRPCRKGPLLSAIDGRPRGRRPAARGQKCSRSHTLAGSWYGLPSVCSLRSEITILHAVVEISGHDVTTTQARHPIWARMALRDNVKDAVAVTRIAMPRETCTRSGNRGSRHESSFLSFSFTSRRRPPKL
jgi:hypothetical protein